MESQRENVGSEGSMSAQSWSSAPSEGTPSPRRLNYAGPTYRRRSLDVVIEQHADGTHTEREIAEGGAEYLVRHWEERRLEMEQQLEALREELEKHLVLNDGFSLKHEADEQHELYCLEQEDHHHHAEALRRLKEERIARLRRNLEVRRKRRSLDSGYEQSWNSKEELAEKTPRSFDVSRQPSTQDMSCDPSTLSTNAMSCYPSTLLAYEPSRRLEVPVCDSSEYLNPHQESPRCAQFDAHQSSESNPTLVESSPHSPPESGNPTLAESSPHSPPESGNPTLAESSPPSPPESGNPTAVESNPPSPPESGNPTAVESSPPSPPESGNPTAVDGNPHSPPESGKPTVVDGNPPSPPESGNPTVVDGNPPSPPESGTPTAVESNPHSSQPSGNPTAIDGNPHSSPNSGNPTAVDGSPHSSQPSGNPTAVDGNPHSSQPSGNPTLVDGNPHSSTEAAITPPRAPERYDISTTPSDGVRVQQSDIPAPFEGSTQASSHVHSTPGSNRRAPPRHDRESIRLSAPGGPSTETDLTDTYPPPVYEERGFSLLGKGPQTIVFHSSFKMEPSVRPYMPHYHFGAPTKSGRPRIFLATAPRSDIPATQKRPQASANPSEFCPQQPPTGMPTTSAYPSFFSRPTPSSAMPGFQLQAPKISAYLRIFQMPTVQRTAVPGSQVQPTTATAQSSAVPGFQVQPTVSAGPRIVQMPTAQSSAVPRSQVQQTTATGQRTAVPGSQVQQTISAGPRIVQATTGRFAPPTRLIAPPQLRFPMPSVSIPQFGFGIQRGSLK